MNAIKKTSKLRKRYTLNKLRLLSLLLMLCMVVSLLPMTALATPTEEITTVDVYDIILPVVGATPDFEGTLPADAPYHFASKEELEELGAYNEDFVNNNKNGITWSDSTDYIGSDVTFNELEQYFFQIVLIPNEGWEFAEGVTATINGETTLVDNSWSESHGTYFNLESDYLDYEITTVDVSDIILPVVGATPDFDVTLPEDANYHIATDDELRAADWPEEAISVYTNGVSWVKKTPFTRLSPTDRFEADNEYYISVALMPNTGYTFSNETTAMVNGSADNADNENGLSLSTANGLLSVASVNWKATTTVNKILPISKTVEKGGNVAPPAETFEFVITDDVEDSTLSPEDYGITFGELKIETTGGEGEFTANVPVEIDTTKATEENGWNAMHSAGTDNLLCHYKTFYLTEKNDGKANWTYDTYKYAVTISYYPNGYTLLEIHVPGNDVNFGEAEFTNTYTNHSITIPFKKTVTLGGNQAPGSTTFNFDIVPYGNQQADISGLKITGNTIATNGKGEYEGTITISGDLEQIYNAEGLKLTEKNDKAANWKYDDTAYIIWLQDGQTGYEASIQKDMGENMNPQPVQTAEFANTYTKNADPVPETGDNSNMITWMALLLVSCGGVVTTVVAKRKKVSSK